MKKVQIKNYKELEAMIKEDEFTSHDDMEWWEGVVYGIFLCGVISMYEKDTLVDLLVEQQEENLERRERYEQSIFSDSKL